MSYMALMEAQARPHSKIYQMPAKEFATGAEALADSQAVRARLRPVVVSRYVRPAPVPEPVRPPPQAIRRSPHQYILIGNIAPTRFEPKWKTIVYEVAKAHLVSFSDIVGHARSYPIVAARQEAYYRLRTELGLSFPEIGRRMGGKDHTGVMHGFNKHKGQLDAAV